MIRKRAMEPLQTALKALLSERNMSQTDLWASAGLSPAVVSRYLSGERGVRVNTQSIEALKKVSRVLGVPLNYWREVRVWQVQEIARQAPELMEAYYDLLIADARLRGINIGDMRSDDGE